MKRNTVMMVMLLTLVACQPAFARGSTGSTPVIVACTVGKNHKCEYPEATVKDKHIYQKLQRFLRKIGK